MLVHALGLNAFAQDVGPSVLGNDHELSATNLVQWIKSSGFSLKHGVTVALVGCDPEHLSVANERALQTDANSSLGSGIAAHAKIVSWMLSALPELKVLCLRSEKELDGSMVRQISDTLKYAPLAIYVDSSFFERDDFAESFRNVIVKAWRQQCLVFTIVNPARRVRVPRGVLKVGLLDNAVPGTVHFHRHIETPTDVLLPLDRIGLDIGSDTSSIQLSAAAYLLVLLAVLPDAEGSPLLERLARLTLTGASNLAQGQTVIDTRRVLDPEDVKFSFAGRNFRWLDRIGSTGIGDLKLPLETGRESGKELVVTAISGQTPVRWVAAASASTDTDPVLLIPQQVQTLLTFRPKYTGPGTSDFPALENILSTQKRDELNKNGIFNVVSENLPLNGKE
jgi:hypothetical protein